MKRILELSRWIAYVVLIVVDGIITVMSMWSLGNELAHSIGLGIIGAVLILLMTWVFLKGIRAKGVERGIYLGAWVLAVVLVVTLNWSFARTSLFAQASKAEASSEMAQIESDVRKREIESTQRQIDALVSKLETVSVWREKDREAIEADLVSAREHLAGLLKPVERNTERVSSVSVFKKMASPIGGNEEQTADFWWLLAFLLLQVFAVLAAPKGDEDAQTKVKRKKREKKPDDWTEWVTQWVRYNWVAVRTMKPGPRMILGDDVFHRFVKDQWREFPDWRHKRIKAAAQSLGILNDVTIVVEDEAEAVKKIKSALDAT